MTSSIHDADVTRVAVPERLSAENLRTEMRWFIDTTSYAPEGSHLRRIAAIFDTLMNPDLGANGALVSNLYNPPAETAPQTVDLMRRGAEAIEAYARKEEASGPTSSENGVPQRVLVQEVHDNGYFKADR